MNDSVIAYAACGSLGYGFPEESLQTGISIGPDFLGCDAGSIDPGPYYLATQNTTKSKNSVKRDLKLLLTAAIRNELPLIIGSAATSGKNWGVDWYYDLVKEIAEEENLKFKTALIYAEIDKSYITEKLKEGKITSLGSAPALLEKEVTDSLHIVGMMGVEPYVQALRTGAQVIIAGRSSDTSIYAAIPLMRGFAKGLVWHAAKVIECGAAVAVPKSPDSLIARIYKDHFILESPNPAKAVRCANVAAHTMYENLHPYIVYEPGGYLDTSNAIYEQIDEKRVKVSGSQFVESSKYTIKLEGAALTGYRSAFIAGTRDEGLISQIDSFTEKLRADARVKIRRILGKEENEYSLQIRLYGHSGVMGNCEKSHSKSHELGILVDVVAETQELADEMQTMVRGLALHQHFENRLCNAGNLAFPFSPLGMQLGPVYRYSVNHLVEVDDPLELFPIQIIETRG